MHVDATILALLQEDGDRWMTYEEQMVLFPMSKELKPTLARPVWLVLSTVLREKGIDFGNGLGIIGHMYQMRLAWADHTYNVRNA